MKINLNSAYYNKQQKDKELYDDGWTTDINGWWQPPIIDKVYYGDIDKWPFAEAYDAMKSKE